MDDVTRTIRYKGDPARASMLVQMLEEAGVTVQWSRPREGRGLATDLNGVIVDMVSTGAMAAIVGAVKQFRSRVPRAKVDIEGEPEKRTDGGEDQ